MLSEFKTHPTAQTCPGLFHGTTAQDGILSRIRIPGGMINSQQFAAIADIADTWGSGYVEITNRANIQIRGIEQQLNRDVLQWLQELGLASSNPDVDHLRNIMTSPTAGIDPYELIDTRSLVEGWDSYIIERSYLRGLSPKFSVCFDGGGQVTVGDRLNDITFSAVKKGDMGSGENIYFRLYLQAGEKGEPSQDTGILLLPEECLPVLAALAAVYLEHIQGSHGLSPRLREVVNHLGLTTYLQKVGQNVSFCYKNLTPKIVTRPRRQEFHQGIHPQRQSGLFYIGLVLPLGRLETWQIRGLVNLAERYSSQYSSSIRLTPWQNLLLTHIPQTAIAEVEGEISNLGLSCATTNIKSGLVACSGKQGCIAAATETKDHALKVAEYLENRIVLDSRVNIHFTGCLKSCAQSHQSDITLLGMNSESYQVYIGQINSDGFGYLLDENVTFGELPGLIEQILQVYQIERLNSAESFREFTSRYQVAQLILN